MKNSGTYLLLVILFMSNPFGIKAISLSNISRLNQDDSAKIFKYLSDARIYGSQRDYEKAVEAALNAAALSEIDDYEYGKYRSYKVLEQLYKDAGKLFISAKYKIKAMTSQSRLEAINYERDEKERIEKNEKERFIREQQRQLEIEQQELKLKMEEMALMEKDKKVSKTELDKKKNEIVLKQKEIENKKQTIDIQKETINSTFNQLSLTLEELETQRLHAKIFEDSFKMIKKNQELAKISTENQTLINYLYLVGLSGFIILSAFIYRMYTVKRGIQELLLGKQSEMELEKKKSDDLIMKILPVTVSEEIIQNGKFKPRSYERVTLMSANLNNFKEISGLLTPLKLVEELDFIFSAFDEIIKRNKLEKVKSNSGYYLCASGIPDTVDHQPMNIIRAAKEMQEFILSLNLEKQKHNLPCFQIQIGIHTGSLVAGIVGIQKLVFDVWGEALTIVNEVEGKSESGKINLSFKTLELIKDKVICNKHGDQIVMGNTERHDMYFLSSILED